MKKEIHPKYEVSKVKCTCGAEFELKTTNGDFNVEVCSQCHPFYTGKTKIIDTTGRVEKFKQKYKMK